MKTGRIVSLVEKYRGYEGFEVVNLGTLPTSLIKGIAKMVVRAQGDEGLEEMLELVKGVKKMVVVDFEDCESAVCEEFRFKVEKILDGVDILMEVRDGSDLTRMYGLVSEDGGSVRDFVLYMPGDCALICFFGSIPIEAISRIVEA